MPPSLAKAEPGPEAHRAFSQPCLQQTRVLSAERLARGWCPEDAHTEWSIERKKTMTLLCMWPETNLPALDGQKPSPRDNQETGGKDFLAEV